jgi:hypothetical protein
LNCGQKEVGKKVVHEVGKKAGKTEIGGTFQQQALMNEGRIME